MGFVNRFNSKVNINTALIKSYFVLSILGKI